MKKLLVFLVLNCSVSILSNLSPTSSSNTPQHLGSLPATSSCPFVLATTSSSGATDASSRSSNPSLPSATSSLALSLAQSSTLGRSTTILPTSSASSLEGALKPSGSTGIVSPAPSLSPSSGSDSLPRVSSLLEMYLFAQETMKQKKQQVYKKAKEFLRNNKELTDQQYQQYVDTLDIRSNEILTAKALHKRKQQKDLNPLEKILLSSYDEEILLSSYEEILESSYKEILEILLSVHEKAMIKNQSC